MCPEKNENMKIDQRTKEDKLRATPILPRRSFFTTKELYKTLRNYDRIP
jgi:hypothetical protein